MSEQTNEVVRLPLWKSCLDKMIEEGVEHGKTYPAEYFEGHLRERRDSMKFGLAISEIRRELEKRGYYLSGRGQNGNQFIILPPENNVDVMLTYQRSAIDALKRGVILGTQTRIDLLKAEDRVMHEKVLEKIATRMALISHTKTIVRALGKKFKQLTA